ncbi:MAG TPA: UDP-N-acetylmuramoyl-L-alanyl-D-glutamate--2,6-diaminopimelate ligase [Candidatus Paceibacterota bacterium]
MKAVLKKYIPIFIFRFYRFLKAYSAAMLYGWPSKDLVIIGVTGTKGKSMTANFIWAGLTGAGLKTGLISTANLRIGEKEFLNNYHMTMPDSFQIHKMLAKMKQENCKVVIIETTSEGIAQFRHKGIAYDLLVFTNLTPEHIQSHGTFENYRIAKQTIFKELYYQRRKTINGLDIPKAIIVNIDSEESKNFLQFQADKKITFTTQFNIANNGRVDFIAQDIREYGRGVSFQIDKKEVILHIPGYFNVSNCLPVFAICSLLNLNREMVIVGLENLKIIPGRMEIVQNKPFSVIVDYAHEKESLTALLKSIKQIKKDGNIILLMGAEGGGRDKAKRALMGEIGAKKADYLIVSNVDPYDEDPKEIISDIAESAKENGKTLDKDLFLIENREDGIKKAISLAQDGDFVLITGKGSEQSMIIGKRHLPWDDRDIVKKLLKLNKSG